MKCPETKQDFLPTLSKILPRIVGVTCLAFICVILQWGCTKETLEQRICVPGVLQCTANGARVCNERGSFWVNGGCAGNQICVSNNCNAGDNKCSDRCEDIICTPNVKSCHTNNIDVLTCNDLGTGYCYTGSCAAPPNEGVCFQGNCVSTCNADQKTYQGCEYFATDLDNARVLCGANGEYCDAAGAQFAVVVSNPDVTKSAHIIVTKGPLTLRALSESCEVPTADPNFVAAARLPPQGLHVFRLPRRDINGTLLKPLAYRISSNIAITAYQFNPLENVDVYSNDASLLLPTTAIGTDYFAMTREQITGLLRGYVTIVGVDAEDTQVTVTTSAKTGAGEGIAAMAAGETKVFTLSQFDVLNLQSGGPGEDLTGTFVSGDKPIMVYAGHEAGNVPSSSRCDLTTGFCEYDNSVACHLLGMADPHEPCRQFTTCCADHLEQQMFPLSAWDTQYIAVRSMPRGEEQDTWRILAAEDNTTVTLTPSLVQVPTLQKGEWFEFDAGTDFRLSANKKVMLGQFLAAEHSPNPGQQPGDAGIGDPAFILVVPERQFRKHYLFLAPDKYAEDYISVALPVGATARLDGTLLQLLPQHHSTSIAGGEWLAIRVAIADGVHNLVCSKPCSVMVHGYDRYVSYGYPGGLNLEDAAVTP